MANKLRIRYTDLAIDDLDVLFSFISEDNRSAAQRLVLKIESAINMLAENPRLGVAIASAEYTQSLEKIRYIAANPYLIFYLIVKNEIVILRILHSKQDWMNMLFMGINN